MRPSLVEKAKKPLESTTKDSSTPRFSGGASTALTMPANVALAALKKLKS